MKTTLTDPFEFDTRKRADIPKQERTAYRIVPFRKSYRAAIRRMAAELDATDSYCIDLIMRLGLEAFENGKVREG